ncbi:hypothetical protein [Streptomyces sp. NPDC020141]|uniref:hypothetical protein n=1 Tax=Streptomyces sp. NPDC020141 TaxID=3365065 RepID=UPI0037B94496
MSMYEDPDSERAQERRWIREQRPLLDAARAVDERAALLTIRQRLEAYRRSLVDGEHYPSVVEELLAPPSRNPRPGK